MRHAIKHHWTRHKHHFGLWALSGLILLAGTLWLKRLPSVFTAGPETLPPAAASVQSESAPPLVLQKVQTSFPTSSAPNAETAVSSSLPATTSTLAAVPDQSLIEVTFEFIASPGATSTLTARVPEGASVYEAMRLLAASAPVQFEFKEYAGLGAMVIAINGVANDAQAQKFWIYYRNGVAAPLGVSSLRVASGDVIRWRYEKSRY
ncbi:MAG: DUF4430 domain-containing protein [Candidatus Magasanikbacteria bacterium]|nr:DUF4430 domain-containing protein [Candidatus Magasanikbacteria bacterium]